jgi:hypothetical protein
VTNNGWTRFFTSGNMENGWKWSMSSWFIMKYL